MIVKQHLEKNQITEISDLLQGLAGKYGTAENLDFLSDLTVLAHQLPTRIRKFFSDFRLADGASAVAILSGYPVAEDHIGPTPAHWDQRANTPPTVAEEFYFMLCGALLGDVFGWATQQGGYLIHDIVPVAKLENEQMGASSKEPLYWHTEDAFHPYRPDHVGLMCLRNPGNTETTVGAFEPNDLDKDVFELLFQPRYAFRIDKSHTEEFQGRKEFWTEERKSRQARAYKKLSRLGSQEDKKPILSGARARPHLCLDPVFINDLSNDPEAGRALSELVKTIEKNLFGVVLKPGDVLFLDNSRVVHGRRSFKALYDGSDRWLKRIALTRDLQKSRSARGGPSARLIF